MYRLRPGRTLVLASASPRRRELLARMGLDFSLAPAEANEDLLPGEDPGQATMRLAKAKARAAGPQPPGAAVLAADTLVVLDGMALGKPEGTEQAREMLNLLAGREHQVLTGYCLLAEGREDCGLASTAVRFRELRPIEIEAYLDGGEAWDKAGAYAVQEVGAALVAGVTGSYTNVVGLPLVEVLELLMARGVIEPAGGGR